MKAIFTLFIPVLMMLGNVSQATTYNVTNAGFTFSPATLTINIGDEVNFDLGVDHNAVEVSKATWDVNGFTSNGGFATPLGGGQVTFLQPGTYYYVCVPHASLSMKGTIVVNTITGIDDPVGINNESFKIYPVPATEFITVGFNVPVTSDVRIDVLDIKGKNVKTIISSEYTSGSYIREVPVKGIVPGRYIIRYLHNGHQETSNLIVN